MKHSRPLGDQNLKGEHEQNDFCRAQGIKLNEVEKMRSLKKKIKNHLKASTVQVFYL